MKTSFPDYYITAPSSRSCISSVIERQKAVKSEMVNDREELLHIEHCQQYANVYRLIILLLLCEALKRPQY